MGGVEAHDGLRTAEADSRFLLTPIPCTARHVAGGADLLITKEAALEAVQIFFEEVHSKGKIHGIIRLPYNKESELGLLNRFAGRPSMKACYLIQTPFESDKGQPEQQQINIHVVPHTKVNASGAVPREQKMSETEILDSFASFTETINPDESILAIFPIGFIEKGYCFQTVMVTQSPIAS